MSKKAEDVDEREEEVELERSDGKERPKNSKRRQAQRRLRFSPVMVVGVAVAAACCVVLVLLCVWFFFKPSLNNGHIEWIQTIPGLHHHPKSEEYDGSFISFQQTDPKSYEPWTEVIEEFLKDYNITEEKEEYVTHCDFDKPRNSSKVCAVDIATFGNCIKQNNFGYDKGLPCIFLRFNKEDNGVKLHIMAFKRNLCYVAEEILDWVPELYNDTNNLPEEMPNHLKSSIHEMSDKSLSLNIVWVSCEWQTPATAELIGPIQYLPLPGFPAYYFPYDNSEHFMSPLVALSFEKPQNGVVISIECQLWAHNIEHDEGEGSGSVRFDLLIN